jgi:hypothetical protein
MDSYKKYGLGSVVLDMCTQEARRRGVQWLACTSMYYNWNWWTHRGWYSCKRSRLWGHWKKFKLFHEDNKTMCFLRPLGGELKRIIAQGGIDPEYSNQ